MTIDLVSTLWRYGVLGDALGFSKETCGHTTDTRSHQLWSQVKVLLLEEHTSCLVARFGIVKYKHIWFIGVLLFDPAPTFLLVRSC